MMRRLVARWIVGAGIGTLLVAVSSPLFVRSYLPLTVDPTRGVWTLRPEQSYRWRSEGYADTEIGPLGMPGKSVISSDSRAVRVVLWGDSQAEGVCVADHEKIFAQAERLSSDAVEVFPMARSGEDAADWLTQFPRVEQALDIDVHVLLIVDLPDLLAAVNAPLPMPDPSDIARGQSAIAATLPAFIIQSARNLLTESDGSTRRRLRFWIGPVDDSSPTRGKTPATRPDWELPLDKLTDATDKPIVLLYAPKSPQIIDGQVRWEDPGDRDFDRMQTFARRRGIFVVDARKRLRSSASKEQWPHGFQNGVIGSGHLNAIGNQIVASLLVEACQAATETMDRSGANDSGSDRAAGADSSSRGD